MGLGAINPDCVIGTQVPSIAPQGGAKAYRQITEIKTVQTD
jgi:hypothetical protein